MKSAADHAAEHAAAVASARAQAAEGNARLRPAAGNPLLEAVSAHVADAWQTSATRHVTGPVLVGVCRCAEPVKAGARLLLWHVAEPMAMFLLLDLCNGRTISAKVGLDNGNSSFLEPSSRGALGLACMGIAAREFWTYFLVLSCAMVNPALVLVDLAASLTVRRLKNDDFDVKNDDFTFKSDEILLKNDDLWI